LAGKILGIYGFGRIGKAVAQRGRGWAMPVLYHQRHRESLAVEKRYNAKFVSFETLLRQSDILSVNSPFTPETRHRFTLKEFRKMKPTSIFVNASRGAIHREADLVKALKTQTIASAGLDVYEFEPKINKALLKLPNCTLLPHLGSATWETRNKMAMLAAENIELVLTGQLPKTPIL
jgi:glyoxylate reductase